MQIVAPELLSDVCGLSPGPTLLTLLAGSVLWLFGWWSHRFWVVLTATVLGGIFGLVQAPALHTPALPTAIMLALAAGLLALSLVRVLVFVAGGLAMVLLAQELWPGLNQPLLVFLGSGLFCHIFFRLCLTALTAGAGAILMMYAALALASTHGKMDALTLADKTGTALNGSVALLALVGFSLQTYVHRRATRKQEGEEEREGLLRLPRVWQWVGGGERDAA